MIILAAYERTSAYSKRIHSVGFLADWDGVRDVVLNTISDAFSLSQYYDRPAIGII